MNILSRSTVSIALLLSFLCGPTLKADSSETGIPVIPLRDLSNNAEKVDYDKVLKGYPWCSKAAECVTYDKDIAKNCYLYGIRYHWILVIKKNATACTCQCP